MDHITASLVITNTTDPTKTLHCTGLVDTGATFTTLPLAWMDQLGPFPSDESTTLQTADGRTISGRICGPVRIKVNGFRPIHNDVLFIDMQPDEDGHYEPLIGYVVLEMCQAAVDMLGHRLVTVQHLDLK